MRTVKVGESDPNLTRVYFDVRLIDNVSPAMAEAGQQPLLSVNGDSFNSSGIGVLVASGYGQYYAQVDPNYILTAGDVLRAVYQRVGVTNVSYGDPLLQVINADDVFAANQATNFVYYGTVGGGDAFFSQRVRSSSWFIESNDNKVKALTQASSMIDRLNFAGEKADSGQLLQFPRRNDDGSCSTLDVVVPQDIVNAAYLIAYKLLDGWDADNEVDNLSATQNRYSGSTTTYDRSRIPEYTRAGIPSSSAWSYLRPFLRDPLEMTLSRVS